MTNSDSQNPHPKEWRILYRAAIFEKNSSAMIKKLSDAEGAIVDRMLELFRETGVEVEGERESMDDAMYALRAWKIAMETRIHAA